MRKNVLYVHHDGGLSGAPISLSYLLEGIDKSEIKARLLCIFSGPVLTLFRSKNVELLVEERIYPFHGSTVSDMSWKLFINNFFRLPQSVLYAYKTIKKEGPDIIHLNSSCLFSLALGAKMANKHIKVICHVREPLRQKSISAYIMRKMNYWFVDKFIAIDQFSAASMKSKSPITLIYNSVDFEKFNTNVKSETIRKQLGIGKEDVVFLYLARISKSNGPLEFLQVAERLTTKYPNFHFILAGFREVEAEASFVKSVKRRMANLKNVHQLAFTKDVPVLIANVDIVLVPFTEPHFARAIIEASAMGVPAIGNRIGGVEELICQGETGFLYTHTDEFLGYCEQLGTNKALRLRMGEQAANFARANFDHVANAKKVSALYDEVLNQDRDFKNKLL